MYEQSISSLTKGGVNKPLNSSFNVIKAGLSTSNQYYVVKIDDNSFKLTSGLVNFDKNKYVNLTSSGVGLQEFFYPEI